MAARRCSTCAINYPLHVVRCHVCGGSLSEMETAQPHHDWKDRADAVGATDTRDEATKIVRWRLEQLLRAGYDNDAADRIAARFQGPQAIDLHQAVELLAAGCAPSKATEILL